MSTMFCAYTTNFESSEIGYIVSAGFACIIVLLGLTSSVIITLTKVLKKWNTTALNSSKQLPQIIAQTYAHFAASNTACSLKGQTA